MELRISGRAWLAKAPRLIHPNGETTEARDYPQAGPTN